MSSRPRGFTLMETLVLIGILIILLSIFIPKLISLREASRRTTCAYNLYQIRDALNNYALLNNRELPRVRYDAANNPDGYTAFTGADSDNPYAENSTVQPNDVTASLWLLVRNRLVANTGVFVCPSSGDVRDLVTDPMGRLVKPTQRGNFRKPSNLSYSYASPFTAASDYRLNTDVIKYYFPLIADKNPGVDAVSVDSDASPGQMIGANSRNHGRIGQNVLFGGGEVIFVRTPYCGNVKVSSSGELLEGPGDNIYTARANGPTTQAAQLPRNVRGLIGHDVAPIRGDDSYLIPTAEDSVPGPAATTVQSPATKPATTTTAPATTQAATTQAATTSAPASAPTSSSAPSQ